VRSDGISRGTGTLTVASFRFSEEFGSPDAEGIGDKPDVLEADVLFAAFDGSHVRPVQSGPHRELFLRVASPQPQTPHGGAELLSPALSQVASGLVAHPTTVAA